MLLGYLRCRSSWLQGVVQTEDVDTHDAMMVVVQLSIINALGSH